MINILETVKEIEQDFDMSRVSSRYGYIPFYDFVLMYCQNHKIKIQNNGVSHFDWECELNKEDIRDLLMIKYKAYYRGK